ncbi:molybdate ABC transporter substrate-binding protein [Deinococcus multiflagellatus]|uniref:Molybdate ABC transporter substrate-binding protein n=1 Tax=Deinococcus multiflagellatus TaxID=1656887 RepID=A0ABW1ZK21_9DEIO|nr:molybdate ABC transporter substrate-binding protein [Deinococcus multiflagellatus]MBZ9712498.1 molybdate ABC transporter substrate-binding protein [Deinococcus multiflagellatus]
MKRPLLLLGLLLAGSAQAANLTVFAAASLTDAFTELGRAFDARTGHRTTFQFAGSQVLRTQLEQGARADVYASANSAQFEPLVRAGLLNPGTLFVSNRLAIIAPQSSRAVTTLADLARPGVKLVIADRAVPAGDYTRRMLTAVEKAGTYGKDFSARVLKNVVSEEPNVRQVALKVGLGEADAAVVYQTDVTPALKAKVRLIALPTRFNQTASYPLGVVKGSANPQAAQAFVAFVLSAEGQTILRRWGFRPAPRPTP